MKLAAAPILGALWLYRALVSAPLHALYGPAAGCRFYPTCSHYATEAVAVHGPLFGLWLSLKRLLKCTPFHAGGVDPVPPRHAKSSLRCERVSSARISAPASLSTSASSASSQLLFHG